MKTVKAIIACLCAVIGTQFCNANLSAATLSVDLKFNIEDFEIRTNDNSCIEISSRNLNASYLSGDDPFLPWISKSIEVPEGYSNDDFELTFEKRLIRSNVKMAMRPTVYSTSMLLSEIPSSDNEMYEGSYPARQCLGTGVSLLKGFDLHYFIFTPFYYDGENSDLYFIDNITLSFKPSKVKNTGYRLRAPAYLDDLDIIKADAEFSAARRASAQKVAENEFNETDIDYVIVTADSLRSVFEPLIRWKTIKGLRSQIITVEDIDAEYPGDDLPLKIKQKLFDLYENNNLKYVLLGGDDYIVPVRECYGVLGFSDDAIIDYKIPVDIYYSCFGGNFKWDGNKNGIFGEMADNVDLIQSLYVCRLPLHLKYDLNVLIGKIIDYEQKPRYSHDMIFAGTNLDRNPIYVNYSSTRATYFYSQYIEPYWNGEMKLFFDTNSDFVDQVPTYFNGANFNKLLAKGYSFIDVISHGDKWKWNDLQNGLYFNNDALDMRSPCHSIITTIACCTNAFDKSYLSDRFQYSLSQSFLRNPNNGVIAYLGSSRQGVFRSGDNTNTVLGYSFDFESGFYENLFSLTHKNKCLGYLIPLAKARIQPLTFFYDPNRWLQYAINPMGDPETPIFTQNPSTFPMARIDMSNSNLTVHSYIDESKIAISEDSASSAKLVVVYNNDCQSHHIDSKKYIVCLTKHNYIPQTIKILILELHTFMMLKTQQIVFL